MLLTKIEKASSELAQGTSQMQKQESPVDDLAASWQVTALTCPDCPTTTSQLTLDL